ncbi:MAG: hypothetical protein ACYTGP_00250 [Planctomycetota bacterium]|jgi:hypothetical protein
MTSPKLSALALGSALLLVPAATVNADEPIFAPAERCEMDYDNSGSIDFGDVLHVMANWGSPKDPSMGSEPDGSKLPDFGFAELLEVINNYGADCYSIID